LAEFAINNKVHSMTKVSSFMENYGRELRMGGDIRRKEKMEKVIEFVERMKKVQKEAEAVSRSLMVDFILFFIFIFILLYFSFSFNFLFLEQLGLGVISHAVTSVTKLMA